MNNIQAPYLFTEARLNIEPVSNNSTLHISTDTSSAFSSRKRARLDDEELDEDTYSRKHIATESSIFFRRQTRVPRSFLWRVLDDRKVLQIQCVDLVQPRKTEQESNLTFSLSFASPIRPNGIAFADSENTDALDVFVLTSTYTIHTFCLRRDLLLRKTAPSTSELEPSTLFKTFTPSSFSFRHPYKLVAISSLELLVSLHDGGLLRLERKAGEGGSQWRETFFSEGGWGSSFRGLIPWKGHNTVRFGNVDLEPGTIAAIEASPDGQHVFTVSLDHTLKGWNLQTGKVGVQVDMLGEEHQEHHPASQYLINPNQNALMQVLHVDSQPDGDSYYVVTNSPKDHQFKFWAIRNADLPPHGIRDVQPDMKFIPPLDQLMNTMVWQSIDFYVKPGSGWRETQLWIRARSGSICRTFTLTFDLLSSLEDLQDAWLDKWAAVDDGPLSIDRLVGSHQFPKDQAVHDLSLQQPSVADQWIEFLFFPGRFSTSLLECALHIYRKGLKLLSKQRSADNAKPLKERLCNAIAAQVKIRRDIDGHTDTERYHSDVAAQWAVYFGLVRHLYQRQTDSLSLAFDQDTGLCWSLRADQFAPIRTCSEVEVHTLNAELFRKEEDWLYNSLPLADHLSDDSSVSVARLFRAAHTFRSGLSLQFNQKYRQLASIYALRYEKSEDKARSKDVEASALQGLYDQCGFGHEVTDEDYAGLTDATQDLGGLGELENKLFIAGIQRLAEAPRGRQEEQALTRQGDRTTIRTAQDTLITGHEILLDLLSLVVFVSQDLEPDELAPGFKASGLYSLLVSKLREHEVLLWLASHEREEQPTKRRESTSDGLLQKAETDEPIMTLLESIFIGDWPDVRFPQDPMASLITYWSRAWTFGPDLGNEYEGVTAHILSSLLKTEDSHLALEFSRFVPSSPWTKYLRARLSLAEGEYAYAAEYFTQATDGLSGKSKVKIDTIDTAGLLDATQRESFNHGVPKYLVHVAALFESVKLLSYAADFASLALHKLETESNEGLDASIADVDRRKQSMQGSPAATRVDLAMEEIKLLRAAELKEDILSRLFNASLQTGCYQTAFEALVQFNNPAM